MQEKKKGRGSKVKGKLQKQNPTGRGQASKKAEREVYTFLEGLIKVDSGKRWILHTHTHIEKPNVQCLKFTLHEIQQTPSAN